MADSINGAVTGASYLVKSGKVSRTTNSEAEARKIYEKIVKKAEEDGESFKVELFYRETPRDKWITIDKHHVRD